MSTKQVELGSAVVVFIHRSSGAGSLDVQGCWLATCLST